MGISPPTEVTTEKNKVSHEPLLLIDFVDLSDYIATQSFALTLGVDPFTYNYTDDIKQGGIGKLTHRISERFDRLSSIANVKVDLMDYRGTLRASMLSGNPDLRDSQTQLRLKFNTSSLSQSDAIKIFDGQISDYEEDADVLSLNLEVTHYKDLIKIPQTNIKETYANNNVDDDLAVPLQYGDFNWAEDPRWWADADNTYATCPWTRSDSSYYYFAIAEHAMASLPTGPSGTYDWNDDGDSYLFLSRDGMWVHWRDSAGAIVTGNAPTLQLSKTVVDTSIWLQPEAEYDSGEYTTSAFDGEKAVDGHSATYAIITPDGGYSTGNWHSFSKIPLQENTVDSGDSIELWAYIHDATGTGTIATLKVKAKSDHAVISNNNITTPDSGWVLYDTINGYYANDLADYYTEVRATVTGNQAEIGAIAFRQPVQDFVAADDNAVYLRCKGKIFGDTWGARKTAANAITHPIDFLESLFRDQFSLTGIKTSTFDALTTLFSGHEVGASIYRQKEGSQYLSDFAEQMNITPAISPDGKILVMAPHASLNFTNSGTGTAGNEDIITDSETFNGSTYTEHPIIMGGFKKDRSSRDTVDKLLFNWRGDFNGNFHNSTTVGSGNLTQIDNVFIGHVDTAAYLASFIYNWQSQQKWLAKIKTFFNAIGFQIGDIKNIRHGDLDDSIVDSGSVNSQKWILMDWSFDFDKGTIDLVFEELL